MTRCALAIAGRQASGLWLVRAGAAWRKPGKNRYGARRSECRQRKRCVALGGSTRWLREEVERRLLKKSDYRTLRALDQAIRELAADPPADAAPARPPKE